VTSRNSRSICWPNFGFVFEYPASIRCSDFAAVHDIHSDMTSLELISPDEGNEHRRPQHNYPRARLCHSHPALTATYMRSWTHHNAQVSLHGIKVHGETIRARLSVDATCLVRELCISIAVHLRRWLDIGRRTSILLLTPIYT